MRPNQIDIETDVLKVKQKVNELKEACTEIQEDERAIMCLSQVKDMESRLDDELRTQEARENVQQLKERHQELDLSVTTPEQVSSTSTHRRRR